MRGLKMSSEIKEIIEDYNGYINKLPSGCEKIVQFLSEDRIEDALASIVDLSEGIYWIVQVKEFLMNNMDIAVGWNEQEIINFLQEINEGLEIRDYVLVSDLIEYELIPFFLKIKAL